MCTAQFLTAALAATSPPDTYSAPPDFGATIDRTESIGSDTITYDYGDGHTQTVVVDGVAQTEATLTPEIIAPRVAAMLDTLGLCSERRSQPAFSEHPRDFLSNSGT